MEKMSVLEPCGLPDDLRVVTSRNALLSLSTPIHRVPTELLTRIFLITGNSPDVISIENGHGLQLSKVCANWRAIACDLPVLWATFSFTLFRQDSAAKLLRLYLQRSRTSLLNIEIRAINYVPGERKGSRHMAQIVEHAERLYSLRFIIDREIRSFGPKVHGLRGRLPRLEILHFSALWRGISDTFEIVPALRTLRIDERSGGFEFKIPSSQIRTLVLSSYFWPSDLWGYSSLTSPTSGVREADHWYVHDILLPHLRSWKISSRVGHTPPANFFDSFTTPVLESLEISTYSSWSAASMTSFIGRSKFELKNLTLNKTTMRSADVIQMLYLLPALQKFVVTHASPNTISDNVLDVLAVYRDCPNYLPKLAHLEIEGAYLFRSYVLLDMLETRAAHTIGLDIIRLSFDDRSIQDDHAERLRSLKATNVSLCCLNGEKIVVRVI